MSVTDRLIKYCKIDTQSNPDNEGQTPSSPKEFDLGNVLVEEMKQVGLEDVSIDEHCYVYGWLPSNVDVQTKTVAFIAHIDTAPDFSGTNVNPRIVENYDGGDIQLNDSVVTKAADFPQMKELVGKTLLVTDGNTLLGADDKAGIAAILEAVEYLHTHPEIPHGRIAVCFTPDEEIGHGAALLDIEKLNADFGYTLDGDRVNGICCETFNAASATVKFHGFSIHPGDAKNKLINAGSIACRYQAMMPAAWTPEHTELREGFIHLISMSGDIEQASLDYIIRDHDASKLEAKKEIMKQAVSYINSVYGENVAEITIKDSYHNMKDIIDQHPEVMEIAMQAMRENGVEPETQPIRGGTDGAELSQRGLPCPNLGTGGGNFHGRYEYCVLEELEQAKNIVISIAKNVAREA